MGMFKKNKNVSESLIQKKRFSTKNAKVVFRSVGTHHGLKQIEESNKWVLFFHSYLS